MKKSDITVVIPAFNEENTVANVVENVKRYVTEVIVVDDSSKDRTAEFAKKAGAIVLQTEKNGGYDKALELGFKEAVKKNPAIIITFDADAQHEPKDIEKIAEPILKDKSDVVVGVRSFKQRVMEFVFAAYSKKKIGISDPLSGVKAYKSEVYKRIGYFDNIGSTGTQLMFNAYKKGFRLSEIPINFYKRKDVSRFGMSIVGNYKIFQSFLKILLLNK